MSVTFSQFGLPIIHAGGEPRVLAALKPTDADKQGRKIFRDFRAVDKSKWKERDLSFLGSPIRNQRTHGSCTGHAGVAAEDITRRLEGQVPVLLSCTFPYGLVNGGVDRGASVSSILRVLEQVGTCTDSEVGTDQIYESQFPQTAWETAKKYQAREAYLCHTYDELCQAISDGFPVAFGIEVGQNFSRLNSQGIAPLPDLVIGGHALCGVGLKSDGVGDWLIYTQNSWGVSWGLKGFCYLTRGHFNNVIDAYALMYTEIIDGPPIAKVKHKKVDQKPKTDGEE